MSETAMLSPDRIPDLTRLTAAAADYDIVRRAIGHIREHWRSQPEIDAIAEAAGVTPTELHHLFRRWAGPCSWAIWPSSWVFSAPSFPYIERHGTRQRPCP